VRVEVKRCANASLDANAYAWVLMDKFPGYRGKQAPIYREAIKGIGGVSETVCVRSDAVDKLRQGWEAHGLGWQTDTTPSKLDGMHQRHPVLWLQRVRQQTNGSFNRQPGHQDAQALGIETLPPAELARLQSQWEENKMPKCGDCKFYPW